MLSVPRNVILCRINNLEMHSLVFDAMKLALSASSTAAFEAVINFQNSMNALSDTVALFETHL